MSNIYLNYQHAMRQAEQIREVGHNLGKMSTNELAETLQQLSGNWEGESASAYLQKGRTLQADINKTAKKLENIATAIEQAAKRILQAEKEAQELANIRTF